MSEERDRLERAAGMFERDEPCVFLRRQMAADIRAVLSALKAAERDHAVCVRHGCGCHDAGATRVECPEHSAQRQRAEAAEVDVSNLRTLLTETDRQRVEVEAENAALRAEALRLAGEHARHAADDRAVIADLRAERDRLRLKLKAVDDAADDPHAHADPLSLARAIRAALASGEESR